MIYIQFYSELMTEPESPSKAWESRGCEGWPYEMQTRQLSNLNLNDFLVLIKN